MGYDILSREERLKILKTLERDAEFRYALAGLLGLREILDELRRLREEFSRRFEVHDRKFAEIMERLAEHDRKFEEIMARLEEHDRKFVAIEEEIKRLREEFSKRFEEHDRRLDEHNRRLSRVEDVLGALAEAFYARSLWEDLREEARARQEVILSRERNVYLDGEEIDLLVVTDKTVYVVEVKTRPRTSDVSSLLHKANTASRNYPDKQVVPILAGARIPQNVAKKAVEKGVKIIVY